MAKQINIGTSRTSNGLFVGYLYDVETKKYIIWTSEYNTREEAYKAAKFEADKLRLS